MVDRLYLFKLNDNVLSILSGLSSLKSLDLSYNKLIGSSINGNAWFLLSILDTVRASCRLTYCNNYLAGLEILSSQLRKLENLDLSYNKLNDSILSNLCGFPSLKSLNLSGNILLRSTAINGKVVNISCYHLAN
jgi:Leucine-rich repeat (LRR) protein